MRMSTVVRPLASRMIERPRIVRSVFPTFASTESSSLEPSAKYATRFASRSVALAVLDVLDDADGLLGVGCDDAAVPGEVALVVGHADRIAGVAGEGDVG